MTTAAALAASLPDLPPVPDGHYRLVVVVDLEGVWPQTADPHEVAEAVLAETDDHLVEAFEDQRVDEDDPRPRSEFVAAEWVDR